MGGTEIKKNLINMIASKSAEFVLRPVDNAVKLTIYIPTVIITTIPIGNKSSSELRYYIIIIKISVIHQVIVRNKTKRALITSETVIGSVE